MREDLYSSIGLYSPSFLKMYIGVEEKLLDVMKLSTIASAAFIHEYVHFLQDITTIYGQKNIMSVVDHIKTVNINQRSQPDRVLKILISRKKKEIWAPIITVNCRNSISEPLPIEIINP